MFEILNEAVLKRFGEKVIMPDDTIITGIFDDPTTEGRLERMEMDYDQPVLYVNDDTASILNFKMELIIRHTVYRVQKKLPDSGGLVAVLLFEKETAEGPWK